jgi:hypothetical protein
VDVYQKTTAILSQKMGNRAVRISYEDLIVSPDRVLGSVYAMLGMEPRGNSAPTGEARDPKSVYREMFLDLCVEQGIVPAE